ncbi:hypothetical protein [Mesoterricola sediminis]|uniref:Uncharacterized protein n=1 Tax=Mesoterricola sediminis TaxID=2927980 RepID=A0AA48HHQ0_9BACT|nr:hypothetical protein [Mesoterricola sediminis]BDU78423.1 hypothetical protein METESE_33810 [Mesoterricola sediminis]
MRTPALMTLALVPAALVAQAPALPDYMTILKDETPKVDELLKAYKPLEALKHAEGLLPATLPAFDKADARTAMKTSISFSGLTRLYLLAAKAAGQAGEWEKVLDFCTKADACARVNHESTKAALSPVIATWTDAVAKAKVFVDQNGERIKALKPATRTAEEETFYKEFVKKDEIYRTTKSASEKSEVAKWLQTNLQKFRDLEAKSQKAAQEQDDVNALKMYNGNLENGPKVIKQLQEAIDATKTEADLIPTKIETMKKTLKDESDEITKGVAEAKVKGKEDKRLKYFENVMKTRANYESRKETSDKLNFLFRLRHNVAGTPLEPKADEIIGRVIKGEDPLGAAPKGAKGKAKKAK